MADKYSIVSKIFLISNTVNCLKNLYIKDEKITHEHIYWDQACVLVQIGLLDPAGLPVCGVESARRILDPSLPTRTIK